MKKQIFNYTIFVVTGLLGVCGIAFTLYDIFNGESNEAPDVN